MSERLLVIIPAWNEEGAVADVVHGLCSRLPDADVLVIDDGSDDRTACCAHGAGALVAQLPFNCGIGPALETGYRYAHRHGYPRLVHCDADGQHSPEVIEQLLECLDGGADFVIGTRFLEDDDPTDTARYRPSFSRRIGIALFSALVSRGSGTSVTDATSGARAAGPRAIQLFADEYGGDYPEFESVVRAARSGLKITQVQIRVLPRAAGRSSFTPLRSIFFVANGLLSIAAARLRPVRSA